MAHFDGRAVSNLSHDDLNQWLQQIRNKSKVRKLAILECGTPTLTKGIFNSFRNLIDLNLNSCNIEVLESDVFDNLTHLKFVNLSNNALRSIGSEVFKNNCQLQVVILNGNLLETIAIQIEHLEIFDLSYNKIAVLDDEFLSCANLQKLFLNNNRITEIHWNAFIRLPHLICLILSSNRIQGLHKDIFKNLRCLRYLNLDDNRIRTVGVACFRDLISLNTFCLGNDYAMTSINVFKNCKYLVFLKLTVSDSSYIGTIVNLKLLTHLNIVLINHQFSWTYHFSEVIRSFKSLQTLKLVIQELNEIKLPDFSTMPSLLNVHIECIEPNNCVLELYLFIIFPTSPYLEHLTLAMLNNFTIGDSYADLRRLTHLNLSGLKNVRFPDSFSNCMLLEYLDLSFTEIKSISDYSLVNLVNLKTLILHHSKLESLATGVFRNNRQLQHLTCHHCRIQSIGNCTFENLVNLIELNLSNNPIVISPDRRLYGLNETCRFIFDH